jgi:uncharacterized protein YjbI with pentapeptide repeats
VLTIDYPSGPNAQLVNADFCALTLDNPNFSGDNLSGAVLEADIVGANFTNANLMNASIYSAYLSEPFSPMRT